MGDRFNLRIELPQLALVALMFLLAAVNWSTAPSRIPVHWNSHGQVDGYGGKFEGLLLLPLITLGLYLVLLFLPRIDPGRANYVLFSSAYGVIRIAVVAFMAAIYVVTILAIHDVQVDVGRLISLGIGLLFVVLGSVLGKVRPNWFVGVRTPWTLSSKRSWVKTHRLGGYLFVLAGLAIVVAALFSDVAAFAAIMGTAIPLALILVIYSYVVWRRDPDKLPPSGSLPG